MSGPYEQATELEDIRGGARRELQAGSQSVVNMSGPYEQATELEDIRGGARRELQAGSDDGRRLP
jgi:hypothetical protein